MVVVVMAAAAVAVARGYFMIILARLADIQPSSLVFLLFRRILRKGNTLIHKDYPHRLLLVSNNELQIHGLYWLPSKKTSENTGLARNGRDTSVLWLSQPKKRDGQSCAPILFPYWKHTYTHPSKQNTKKRKRNYRIWIQFVICPRPFNPNTSTSFASAIGVCLYIHVWTRLVG